MRKLLLFFALCILWLFAICILCLSWLGSSCRPPPPPPCESERVEWLECEATGGTWVEGESGCSCYCPDGVFIEDRGCVDPRVDRLCPLGEVTGLISFGMTLLDEGQIIADVEYAKAHGHDTYRVGAWLDGWCETGVSYLPCGPAYGSEEADENLRRLLDVTSRIPDIWIQLIPTFTHKGDDGGLPHFMAMTERVIAIVQAGTPDDPTQFRHVVWEAANEHIHPISKIRHRHIKKLLERLRETGLPVGVDYSFTDGYPEDLLPLVDYVAFHTPRFRWKDGKCTSELPSRNRMRKVIRQYDKPVWMDETVKYVSDYSKEYYDIGRGGGYVECAGRTEARRKKAIMDFKADVEWAGARWFTHATHRFYCIRPGWLPN